MANAEDIRIVGDERGFELHVLVDEDPTITESGWLIVNVHSVAEQLYNQARVEIGPWLREAEEARASMPPNFGEEDEDSGYDLSDPKHPTYHDRMSEIWDSR
jgi:hypothetical protein